MGGFGFRVRREVSRDFGVRVLGQVEGCFKSVRVIVRADRQFEVSGLCGWAVVEIQIAKVASSCYRFRCSCCSRNLLGSDI